VWIVAGVRDGDVGEEAIVEEGAFETEVDQCVKSVPDEQDAEFGGCAGGEETEGEDVGGDEEEEGGKKGKDCGAINYERGDRRCCGSVHCCDRLDLMDSTVLHVVGERGIWGRPLRL